MASVFVIKAALHSSPLPSPQLTVSALSLASEATPLKSCQGGHQRETERLCADGALWHCYANSHCDGHMFRPLRAARYKVYST